MEKNGKRYAMMALAAMCVMYISVTGVAWNTITLFAESIVSEWKITATQFMFAVTILACTNALMSIFCYGFLETKLGIRRLMLFGGLLAAAAMTMIALAHSLPVLYVAAFLFGVGISPLNSNTNLIAINAWFKSRVGTYVGIPTTCGSVTGIVAATVYGILIARLGWRTTMWITVAILAVATVLMQLLYRGEPEKLGVQPYGKAAGTAAAAGPAEAESGVSFLEMLKSPRFYILALGYLLVGITGYGAMGNLALMVPALGYGELTGTVVSVALLGSAVTMVICGSIMDKLGSKWLVTILIALTAAAMLLLQLEHVALPLVYVAAALLGLGYNACLLPAGIAVKEVFGSREYGKKVGILVGLCFVGLSFGPTVMTAVVSRSGGYSSALRIFVGLAVLTVVLVLAGSRPVKAAVKK